MFWSAEDANGNPKGPRIWPFGVRKYEKSVWCLGRKKKTMGQIDDDRLRSRGLGRIALFFFKDLLYTPKLVRWFLTFKTSMFVSFYEGFYCIIC